MGNMGYCRFRNTLTDLRDCNEHLWDDLSDDEAKARDALVALCAEIAADASEGEGPEDDGQPDERKEFQDFAHDDEFDNIEASEVL